ncbi:MAG: NAD(P)-binding domain-containing protein [Ancrocorticia sp.]
MRIQEPPRGSQRRSFSRIPTGAWIPAVSPSGNAPVWNLDGARQVAVPSAPRNVDVLVIGAGQAGLAIAHELQRRGFSGYADDDAPRPASDASASDASTSRNAAANRGTFLVLDAENRPGGAWQHRWPSLTMATVNHIADLPGLAAGHIDPTAESADWIPSYFAEFEEEFDLPILRPALVTSVVDDDTSYGAQPRLLAHTTVGTFRARAIVNCTGTWTRPFIPYYPGAAKFRGIQCHTQDYPGTRAFEGRRVVVVGGGSSALSHLDDLDGVAKKLLWVTRTPPRWHGPFDGGNTSTTGPDGRGLTAEFGKEVESAVRQRVESGLAPLPVVATTGLPINNFTRSLHARGLTDRKPMFTSVEADAVVWRDGKSWQADAIIWATGFRAELRHLMPLGLRVRGGGIVMDGTHVAHDRRIHLLGYGPSASTVGARWASRRAAKDIVDYLGS